MINEGKVFILDYKLLHGVRNVDDLTEKNTTDDRKMRKSRSPFCIFVSANEGGVNNLKPAAIQTDLFSGSHLTLTRYPASLHALGIKLIFSLEISISFLFSYTHDSTN